MTRLTEGQLQRKVCLSESMGELIDVEGAKAASMPLVQDQDRHRIYPESDRTAAGAANGIESHPKIADSWRARMTVTVTELVKSLTGDERTLAESNVEFQLLKLN